DQRVAPGDVTAGHQRRPPLASAGGVEGVDATQRVALHEVLVLGGDLGDLVLADQGVAADQHGRGDRPTPAGADAVVGVAPQGVVVAVGDRHVAERVGVRLPVVGRHRVRLGDADAGAQAGHTLL